MEEKWDLEHWKYPGTQFSHSSESHTARWRAPETVFPPRFIYTEKKLSFICYILEKPQPSSPEKPEITLSIVKSRINSIEGAQ